MYAKIPVILANACDNGRRNKMFELHKTVIVSPSELCLSGQTIAELTGKTGKDIGVIKQWLFDEITKEKTVNEEGELVVYLQTHYVSS